MKGARTNALLPLRGQFRWFMHLISILGCLSRTHRMGDIPEPPGLGIPGLPLEDVEEVAEERSIQVSLHSLLPQQTLTLLSIRNWMDVSGISPELRFFKAPTVQKNANGCILLTFKQMWNRFYISMSYFDCTIPANSH